MKILAGLLAMAVLLAGCDTVSQVEPADNTTQQVPSAVTGSLRRLFPTAQQVTFSPVEKNKIWVGSFTTNAPYSVVLGANGSFYAIYRQISAQQLPDLAQRAIRQGAVIKNAYQELSEQLLGMGYVAVASVQKDSVMTYQFSQTGQLQTSVGSTARTVQEGVPDPTVPYLVYYLTADELPAAVKSYLTANYAQWTVNKAVVEITNGVKRIYVYLLKEGKGVDLYLDEQGNVLPAPVQQAAPEVLVPDVFVQLAASDLPPATRDFLTKNYPGWSYLKGVVSTTTGKATMLIQVQEITYQLTFDKDWVLVSSQKY